MEASRGIKYFLVNIINLSFALHTVIRILMLSFNCNFLMKVFINFLKECAKFRPPRAFVETKFFILGISSRQSIVGVRFFLAGILWV